MKKLLIATVIVMLTPSLGMAGQRDADKCIEKHQANRKKLAASKKQVVEERERSSSNTGVKTYSGE